MQSVFQIGQEHSKQKRNRVSLNCLSCKRRKIKCDRNKPCGSCVKYGSVCEYSQPVWTKAEQDESFSVQRLDGGRHMSGDDVDDVAVKKRKANGVEKRSSVAVNEGTGKPHDGTHHRESDDSGVFAQLEFLKSKLHELESKVHDDKLSRSSSHTSTPAVEKKPLDWESITSTKINDASNPTFVGINPYNESNPEETINFYTGYSPVHIQDIARRYSHGPFAWLTLLKKDPAQSHIWKYLHSVRQENRQRIRQTPRAAKLPPLINLFKEGGPQSLDKSAQGCCGTDGAGENTEINKFDQSKCKHKAAGQEWEFRQRAVDRDGFNDLRLYGNVRTNFKQSGIRDGTTAASPAKEPSQDDKTEFKKDVPLSPDPEKKSRGAMSFGKGKIEEELNLIENLRGYLPKQKVIWKSIELFFAHLYPFFPLLDESDFVREMERILGPKGYSDDKSSDLKIEKRLDLAYLGTLFIVLRFAYVALITNRKTIMGKKLASEAEDIHASDVQYLLMNPSEMNLIEMAELCLDQFNLNRRSSLIVLQCTFLLRLYYMFAPEHGDGADGGDSLVINGLMVQMALSIGLHRDGSLVTNKNDIITDADFGSGIEEDSPKTQNLHRKIWFFLVICDLIQGYQYGNPLCIRQEMYDTRLPYYQLGNENIDDVEKEKHVVSTFAYLEKYRTKLVDILNTCLNLHTPANLKTLTSYISDFEVLLNNNFGILKLFLIPYDKDNYAYPFLKIMKCKNYINMKMFLNGLLAHMFIHFESQAKNPNQSSEEQSQRQSLAFFYLRKVMASLYGEFLPNIFQLLYDNPKNFGTDIGCDLTMNPFIEAMLHKISQFSFAMLTRLNSTIYLMRSDPEAHELGMRSGLSYRLKYAKLVKLSQLVEMICEIVITAMSRLSQRYYYAWKITKAHSYIMSHCMRNQEFFKLFHEKKQLWTFLECSDEQLNELTTICEKGSKPYVKCRKKFSKMFAEGANGAAHRHNCADEDVVGGVAGKANSAEAANFTERDNRRETSMANDNGGNIRPPSHQDSVDSNAPSTATDYSNIINNPLSTESWSSLDDFNTVSNTDIDNLWILLKMKTSPFNNDSNVNQNQGEYHNSSNFSVQSPVNNPFTPSGMTPFWQSFPQPYQQSQQHQQHQQQQQQQQGYQQPAEYQGGNGDDRNGDETQGSQFGGNYLGDGNGGELKTLNDFDVFNSFPLEEMLGIASTRLP
ncbi:hypothetical protein CANMA_000658 [Candida margitis]|uniref:uncharacterized protein n=1 Tax=Candida margitis TaxID=1775924 RepID=UPI0022278600|nr:uncharacterized protein CANMA_000658 [Candida margitis]KAI5970306.1 hypothetical protein CANMA_000658 [Candida margitis]